MLVIVLCCSNLLKLKSKHLHEVKDKLGVQMLQSWLDLGQEHAINHCNLNQYTRCLQDCPFVKACFSPMQHVSRFAYMQLL